MPSSRWSELYFVLFSSPTRLPLRSRWRRGASEKAAWTDDEVGSTSTSLMWFSSVFMQHHPADVPPLQQVPVALVDLLEPVPPSDQLVQLEVAGPVQAEQLGDVVE